jgi:antitoxin VapB
MGLSVEEYVERLVERHPTEPRGADSPQQLRDQLMKLARRWHELPTLDPRSADEMIGYDEYGLPSA